MKLSTNFCKLLNQNRYSSKYIGYKWPTLSELYYKLFAKNIIQSHNSLDDCKVLLKCVKEGRKYNLWNLSSSTSSTTASDSPQLSYTSSEVSKSSDFSIFSILYTFLMYFLSLFYKSSSHVSTCIRTKSLRVTRPSYTYTYPDTTWYPTRQIYADGTTQFDRNGGQCFCPSSKECTCC